MTDDESDYAEMPSGRRAQLRYSISNLWDDLGSTDSVGLGLTINVGLAALGLLVFAVTDGWLAYGGIAWAILNGYPVLQWVFTQ